MSRGGASCGLSGFLFEKVLKNNRGGLGVNITLFITFFAIFKALFGFD
jgi:hypothetical protein